MNRIAKIAVDLSLDREFDYLIPDELHGAVEIGSRVEVPFGKRHVNGFVVGIAEESAFDELKPIAKVLGEKSLVTEPVMELARWMSYVPSCRGLMRMKIPVLTAQIFGARPSLMVKVIGYSRRPLNK